MYRKLGHNFIFKVWLIMYIEKETHLSKM